MEAKRLIDTFTDCRKLFSVFLFLAVMKRIIALDKHTAATVLDETKQVTVFIGVKEPCIL